MTKKLYMFDGCSGFPDKLFGIDYTDLCYEHDGCDIDHYYETGEQTIRSGPSYVNGGPLRYKVKDDFLLAYRMLIRGISGEREWYWWFLVWVWLLLPFGVFFATSLFGLPKAPKFIADIFNRGIDFRWGKVSPLEYYEEEE